MKSIIYCFIFLLFNSVIPVYGQNNIFQEKYRPLLQNLEEIKILLELYAEEYGGVYPGEISASLLNDLDKQERLLRLKNPFTGDPLNGNNVFTDYYIYRNFFPGLKFFKGDTSGFSGLVVYRPLEFRQNEYNPDRTEYKRYVLYLTDEYGDLLEKDGRFFSYEREAYHPLLGKPVNRDVVDNALSFRQVVRNYLVASGVGFYPASVEQLYTDAVNKEYWRNLKNPFTGKKDKDSFVTDFKIYNRENNKTNFSGFIVYAPEDCGVNEEGKAFCRRFKILSAGSDGKLM